jgi:hypothetical protein
MAVTHSTAADGTFSAEGATAWDAAHTVGDNSFVAAKLSASAANKVFGSTGAAGAGVEIDCTAAGRALLDDADAAAQRATLGILDAGVVIVTNDGSAAQSITQSSVTKISTALATEVLDQNGWWDTTNKRFLPDRAGKYLISCGLAIASVDANATMIVFLHKNGVEHKRVFRGYLGGSAGTTGGGGAAVVELNGSTDYIEMYGYHTSAAARNTEALASSVFFNAFYIGS